MDVCLYIPGIDCVFINLQKGVALLHVNIPDSNIKIVEIHRDKPGTLRFVMHMKATTTFDEQSTFFRSLSYIQLPCSGGKIFTKDDVLRMMITSTPESEHRHLNHVFWKNLFAEQSREFTPFELISTRLVIFKIYKNVDDTDISDVITSLFGIIGLIRDDVDTKPARPC